MIKHILAAVMLLVGSASAQWLGQARQTAVLTNSLTSISSPRSNLQQVIEWVDSHWPTNISNTNIYVNQGSIYFTNYYTSTGVVSYQVATSNMLNNALPSLSNSIQSLSNQVVGLTNFYIKGTNIAGAVSFANNTWSLKNPKYFFEAHKSNYINTGTALTWYELNGYTTQAAFNGLFDIASGEYLAKTSGWYHFSASVTHATDSIITNSGFRVGLSVNGSTTILSQPFYGVQIGSGNYSGIPVGSTYNGSLITRLLLGDVVSIYYLSTTNFNSTNNYISSATISGYMIQEAGYEQ